MDYYIVHIWSTMIEKHSIINIDVQIYTHNTTKHCLIIGACSTDVVIFVAKNHFYHLRLELV